jgi:hypothetical protein
MQQEGTGGWGRPCTLSLSAQPLPSRHPTSMKGRYTAHGRQQAAGSRQQAAPEGQSRGVVHVRSVTPGARNLKGIVPHGRGTAALVCNRGGVLHPAWVHPTLDPGVQPCSSGGQHLVSHITQPRKAARTPIGHTTNPGPPGTALAVAMSSRSPWHQPHQTLRKGP